MLIRKATLQDMADLIELRIECLRDMDGLTEEQEERVRGRLEPYFTEHLDRDLTECVYVSGKPLYDKLGFKIPHYTGMRLRLI